MEGFTPLFQTAEDEYAKFTDKEDLIANFMSHFNCKFYES